MIKHRFGTFDVKNETEDFACLALRCCLLPHAPTVTLRMLAIRCYAGSCVEVCDVLSDYVSPDLKALVPFLVHWFDVRCHFVDLAGGATLVQVLDKLLELLLRAFGFTLNRVIVSVAHPASYACCAGLLLHMASEVDALHSAVHLIL